MYTHITSVVHMMRRALNTLDYRLMDHGERVSYMLLRFFEKDNIYDNTQLRKIAYLGILHDIGAYKTEHIDSLVSTDSLFRFDMHNTFPHSVYSYLFLKECSFLDEFADAVLFHHFSYDKLLKTDCSNKLLSARMFLADRVDILVTKGLAKTPEDIMNYLDNPVFCQQEVKNLKLLEQDQKVLTNILNNKYLDELFDFFKSHSLSYEQIDSLVQMLPRTIDFRSASTVTHTVATVEIAVTLAKLFEMTKKQVSDIYYGALLHDIGKISISLMILEKQTALSDSEYFVMKDHVLLSEYILKDRVSKKILNIAIRHHEKLDGSGYPYGLTAEQLTLSERIVAVSDILSALMGKRSYKEPFAEDKVKSIILQMAASGHICDKVVQKAIDNYSMIEEKVTKASSNMVDKYMAIETTAKQLLNQKIF